MLIAFVAVITPNSYVAGVSQPVPPNVTRSPTTKLVAVVESITATSNASYTGEIVLYW
jgi:hypothetical protein